ncbi:hypothetical protein BD779DRAFT_1548254 [Infundibulicybe gibba]|nr:hypothetical protein BD779DRAFT_1548254 [Infundibulicybe gibba]
MDEIPELANLDLNAETLSISFLPSEIIDLVIDQLEGDRAALKFCSLVCRSWLPRTRHHLFSSLNIRTRPTPALDLLQSPLGTIHPHVQRLKLCIVPSNTAQMVACVQEVDAGSMLSFLRMKTLSGAGLTLVDPSLQGVLLTLKGLRHLKLQHFRFKDIDSGIRLLASLPLLESLVLYGVDLGGRADSCSDEDQDALMHSLPPPPNLRRLFIGTIEIPHELRWLSAHPTHQLTTLHLHNITSGSLPIILDYLRLSYQLQCLSFDFCRWDTAEVLQRTLMARIDLRSQKDLRCIRLNSTYVVPLLCDLLPRIRSQHMEELAMSAGGYPGYPVWADLRDILVSPVFGRLKRVYVDEEHASNILELILGLGDGCDVMRLMRGGEFKRNTAVLSLPSSSRY